MAKPVEDKEEKNNIQSKFSLDMNPNLLMIINNIVLIVVFVAAMCIMYALLESSFSKKISQITSQEEQLDEAGLDERQEGILLDLGEFVLNLADSDHRRYLKVGVAMELSKTEDEMNMAPSKPSGHGAEEPADANSALVAEMERYKPAIRDAVISVLSNKTSTELSTPTGKEIAKEEILEMVNNIFEGQRETLRVSFGQFIIQ